MTAETISNILQTVTIVTLGGGFLWTITKDRRGHRKEDAKEERDEMLAMGGHVVATNAQLLTMIQDLRAQLTALETKVDTIREERDGARVQAAEWRVKYDAEHERRVAAERRLEAAETQLRLTPKRSSDSADMTTTDPPGST